MDPKAVSPIKTIDEIKKNFLEYKSRIDPDIVLREADKEIKDKTESKTELDSNLFKAMTLNEFENGMLLTYSMAEQYKTFALDLLRRLRAEYDCKTPSENLAAELVANNYIRTLEIQRRITSYLSLGTISEIGVRFLSVLSSELDRANRHFLSSLMALKTMRQPHFGVSIKAETAVVGQNQLIQTNSS